MAKERIKLTVKETSEPREVGSKGAKKLQFKASGPDGKELTYFTFSTRLFEYIRNGETIDCDIDTTTRDHEGNTYTDRKLVQIYENGQPVMVQQQGGWGKPDNTASIESQTAAKIAGELLVANVITKESSLGSKLIAWCEERLAKLGQAAQDGKGDVKTHKDIVPGEKAETSNAAGASAAATPIKNAGDLFTRALRLNPPVSSDDLLVALSVSYPKGIKDLEAAWKVAQEISRSKVK